MVSNNYHQGHNPTFSPVTPHFHRMVLQDALFDNKLKIPGEFMIKYGTTVNTSKPVLLRVPSGGEWAVKLTKCGDYVWLSKGWPEFARHHSIKCGSSLFFRYEGQPNSTFHVVIVDENGSEIDYPVTNSTHFYESNPSIDELPKREEEVQENDDCDSDENFNGCSPCLKRKEKSPPPFSWPKRRMKTKSKLRGSTSGGTRCYNDEQVNIRDAQSSKSEEIKGRFKSRAKEAGGEGEPLLKSKERLLTTDEKAKASSMSKNFAFQNPYFKVVIQKSYVHDHYELVLPSEFWIEHLNEKSIHDVTLYIPHGRTWLVKLHTRTIYGCTLPRAAFSKRGWWEFAVDNNLKVGDVCTFELINKNEMLFKVSINREAEYGQDSQQSQAGKSEAKPVQPKVNPSVRFKMEDNLHNDETGDMSLTDQTSEYEFQRRPDQGIPNDNKGNMKFGTKSKDHTSGQVNYDMPSSSRGNIAFEEAAKRSNPSFKVKLRESFCNSLRMPLFFGRTYFGGKPQAVTLQVGKKLWCVKLASSSGGLVFCGGWPAFARENQLHPGDYCVFELVRKERNQTLLKVTISQPTVI